jgi:hypothetical protein
MTPCIERVKHLLHESGANYEVRHHREVFTTQAAAAELH